MKLKAFFSNDLNIIPEIKNPEMPDTKPPSANWLYSASHEHSNRNINRFFLILSFIMINVLLLWGIDKALGFLNSGADRTSMLHLDKETVNTYLPEVTWESNNNSGREMEPNTLKTIEKHYLFSWYVKNRAFLTNSKEIGRAHV